MASGWEPLDRDGRTMHLVVAPATPPATPDPSPATSTSTSAPAPPAWAAGVAMSRPTAPITTEVKEGKEGDLVVKKGGDTKGQSKEKKKKKKKNGEKDAPPAEAVRSIVVEKTVSALAGPPSMALPGTGGSAAGSGHGMAIDGYTPRFSVKDTAERRRRRSAAADAAKGSSGGKGEGKGEGKYECITVSGSSNKDSSEISSSSSKNSSSNSSNSTGAEAPPAAGEDVVAVGKASRRSPLDAAADTGPGSITSTRAPHQSTHQGPVLHPALSDEDIIERCKDGPSGESIVADLEFRCHSPTHLLATTSDVASTCRHFVPALPRPV